MRGKPGWRRGRFRTRSEGDRDARSWRLAFIASSPRATTPAPPTKAVPRPARPQGRPLRSQVATTLAPSLSPAGALVSTHCPDVAAMTRPATLDDARTVHARHIRDGPRASPAPRPRPLAPGARGGASGPTQDARRPLRVPPFVFQRPSPRDKPRRASPPHAARPSSRPRTRRPSRARASPPFQEARPAAGSGRRWDPARPASDSHRQRGVRSQPARRPQPPPCGPSDSPSDPRCPHPPKDSLLHAVLPSVHVETRVNRRGRPQRAQPPLSPFPFGLPFGFTFGLGRRRTTTRRLHAAAAYSRAPCALHTPDYPALPRGHATLPRSEERPLRPARPTTAPTLQSFSHPVVPRSGSRRTRPPPGGLAPRCVNSAGIQRFRRAHTFCARVLTG